MQIISIGENLHDNGDDLHDVKTFFGGYKKNISICLLQSAKC